MPELPVSVPDPKDRPPASTPRNADGPTMPSKKEQEKKRNPPPTGWITWLPVAVGVVLGFCAPMLQGLLANFQPWGMRAVFPFVLLSGLRETGFSDEFTRTLPQIMLLIQFPVEGLLAKFMVSRGVKLSSALGQLVFLHALCALVLFLVAGGAQ